VGRTSPLARATENNVKAILRTLITVVAAACTLSRGAVAQARSTAGSPVGVWRGTSLCLVRESPCHDEIVVYRITAGGAADSFAIDARKIVNGQEEEMGILDCRFTDANAELRCIIPRAIWSFTVRRDSLVGELRLRDGRKFRDVRTVRSRPTPPARDPHSSGFVDASGGTSCKPALPLASARGLGCDQVDVAYTKRDLVIGGLR
jgi:hypothetical protein